MKQVECKCGAHLGDLVSPSPPDIDICGFQIKLTNPAQVGGMLGMFSIGKTMYMPTCGLSSVLNIDIYTCIFANMRARGCCQVVCPLLL